jgi:hypothetical protein
MRRGVLSPFCRAPYAAFAMAEAPLTPRTEKISALSPWVEDMTKEHCEPDQVISTVQTAYCRPTAFAMQQE